MGRATVDHWFRSFASPPFRSKQKHAGSQTYTAYIRVESYMPISHSLPLEDTCTVDFGFYDRVTPILYVCVVSVKSHRATGCISILGQAL